jgi:hypothetical protein
VAWASLTPSAPAVLAFALLAVVVGNPSRLSSQGFAAVPSLEFHGLEVGVPIRKLSARVGKLGGTLSCRPAKDPRLEECTGSVRFVQGGPRFSLIVSSVRDSAAVVILSGAASRDTAASWADSIAVRQGHVTPRNRGQQRTWQWVRYRQMLRLIHRREDSASVLTITLTDGPLLDNLGAPLQGRPRSSP